MDIFPYLRYAEQLVTGDEVLIQRDVELTPEKVVDVSDISMSGDNHLQCSLFIHHIFLSWVMWLIFFSTLM